MFTHTHREREGETGRESLMKAKKGGGGKWKKTRWLVEWGEES